MRLDEITQAERRDAENKKAKSKTLSLDEEIAKTLGWGCY